MRELQERQKFKQRLYSIPVLIVLGILALFFVRGAVNVLLKHHESGVGVQSLTLQAAALRDKQIYLENEVARLQTEEGINEEIKYKFNVSEAGEHVAIIIDNRETATTIQATGTSWWKRMLGGIID